MTCAPAARRCAPDWAAHSHLAEDVSQGRFRQDLYFRVRVMYMRIPARRERVADVDALREPLLARVASRMERPVRGVTDAARQFLADRAWPGNVRELELGAERACTVSEPPLTDVGDLSEVSQQRFVVGPPTGRARPLREMERKCVRLIVQRHRGERRRSAEELQISLATLKRKLIERRRSV